MRDIAALLRRELENLEIELAADPRVRKAQKIRELLAIYSNSPAISAADPPGAGPELHRVVPIREGGKPRLKWLREALRLKRPEGSAAIARSRLIAISQSNNWTNASPAWFQLPRDATGRPLIYGSEASPSASQSLTDSSSTLQSSATSARHEQVVFGLR
jgi:hypothetical protein